MGVKIIDVIAKKDTYKNAGARVRKLAIGLDKFTVLVDTHRPDPVTLENGTMANDGWLRFLAALTRLDLRLHELGVAVEGPPNKPKRTFEKPAGGNGSGCRRP